MNKKAPKEVIDNVLRLPLQSSIKHRIPWLMIGLIGGLGAAGIVEYFESTLKDNIVLAAFIPLIVYMSDAVGTQMEAFVLRDYAINPSINFKRYFMRQLAIIAVIGFLASIVLFIATMIFYMRFDLSFVLSFSLFVAVISSIFTGLIIPKFLGRFRLDPANASGPIATLLQDIMSVFIFFGVASLLL